MTVDRVVLVGEDRAHIDFLRELASRKAWRIVDQHSAPRGRGAASGWVVRFLRNDCPPASPGLGLLAMIDGDNHGFIGRTTTLPLVTVRCAVLIPSWSIDTWLLAFAPKDPRTLAEHDKTAKRKARRLFAKPHPGFLAPGADAHGAPRNIRLDARRAAVEGFLTDRWEEELPSLGASRRALARI